MINALCKTIPLVAGKYLSLFEVEVVYFSIVYFFGLFYYRNSIEIKCCGR